MDVRIGKVQNVNTDERKVRVYFGDVRIMSDWLKVIHSPTNIAMSEDRGDADESEQITLAPWMPDIGDSVLCLYAPGFNSDGYVIGGI